MEADGTTRKQDDQYRGAGSVRPAADPGAGQQALLLHPQLCLLPLPWGAVHHSVTSGTEKVEVISDVEGASTKG